MLRTNKSGLSGNVKKWNNIVSLNVYLFNEA